MIGNDDERPRDRIRRYIAMEVASAEAALEMWGAGDLPLTRWRLGVLNEMALFFNRHEAEQMARKSGGRR